jgi:phosphatidylinositol alpha-1,6-mannosyltransferase
MSEKQILLLTSEYPPFPGGIGNHAFHLAHQLTNHGYTLHVIVDERDRNTLYQETEFDLIHQIHVKRVKRYLFTSITYFSRVYFSIFFILKYQPSVIFCSGKFPLWMGIIIKLFFYKLKIIGIIHGSELRAGNIISKAITKFSLPMFSSLVAVSNFTKNQALKINPKLNIHVINNGFLSNFSSITNNKYKDSSNNLQMVTVGNLNARKGQHNVIKAIPLLLKSYPNLVYHIIGIKTELASITLLIESLNIQKNVLIHGPLSEDNKYQIMIQCDIFIMLSEHLKNGDFEGFGIALLEANNIGLPAIGSMDSGIEDAIKDNYSGRLVDPHNPIEIVGAIKEILSEYDKYSINAVKWSNNFLWENKVNDYLRLLE